MKNPLIKDKHPLAINILKLQRYNFSFLSCEEVVFFEYIVVKGMAFKGHDTFYHSSYTIQKETGIKKHALQTIISHFAYLGIIDVEVKGIPRVKHFRVNFVRIMELFPKIFHSAENGKLSADFSQLLADFFQPLADIQQQKNIIKNTKKNNKEEIHVSDSDREKMYSLFFNYLSSLHYELNVKEENVVIDQPKLLAACRFYGAENVLFYLKKYFNEKGAAGSTSDYLKIDSIDNRKLVYIEQQLADERQHVNSFFSTLNSVYNIRREKASNDDEEFEETQLPINNASKKLITDALAVKSEMEIKHAFTVYCDKVLNNEISPKKFLPYFFSKQFGEYGVIDALLEDYNLNYVSNKYDY